MKNKLPSVTIEKRRCKEIIDMENNHQDATRIRALEEALRFYADKDNYADTAYSAGEILEDEGEIARQALTKSALPQKGEI